MYGDHKVRFWPSPSQMFMKFKKPLKNDKNLIDCLNANSNTKIEYFVKMKLLTFVWAV